MKRYEDEDNNGQYYEDWEIKTIENFMFYAGAIAGATATFIICLLIGLYVS